MNRYVRSLLSIAALALLMLYGLSVKPALVTWGGLSFILLVYLVMIWARPDWWTRARYALSACPVLALVLLLSLFNGRNTYGWSVLLPLVMLLAREQQKYRNFAALLAAVTLVIMIVILPAYEYALSVVPVVIALYFSIRAINVYKESYRLSQKHVQQLAEAHQELQQMHATLQEASDHSMRYAALAERARLARDMHDGMGHQLTSLIVQLQALEIMLPGDPQQAARAVPVMLEVARKAMGEVRQVVRAWQEDESGLGLVALQGLVLQCAAHSRLALEFQQQGELSEWSVELSVALYRVLQEALTNIMRHAEATTVTIQVQERDQQVILTVSDDGCYMANTELSPGFGIKGIMERSQSLRGSCTLSQNQPHGLNLQVVLPVTARAQDDGALKRTAPSDAVVLPSLPFSE